MKHLVFGLLLACGTTAPSLGYGLGCIAHNYVAKEVAPLLQEYVPELYELIDANNNDYLVASDFPDTGFVPGATYGEYTHHQEFVNTYITYLQTYYPDPSDKRDRLLAYLMGICTHNQSDNTSHWIYYEQVAQHDFASEYATDPSGAWQQAHQLMDPGSDFYVIVNKHIYNHPVNWWVPVSDLVAIFNMKHKNVSVEELIRSNIIYYLAVGWDETLIALPAYLYDSYVAVPWGMANLETPDPMSLPPIGAFPGQINDSVVYVLDTWTQYQSGNDMKSRFRNQRLRAGKSIAPWISPSLTFMKKAVEKGWITVTPVVDSDGSITITPDCVVKTKRYDQEKKRFLNQLKTAR